ncbi:MAG: hypothetical protein PHX61_07430 [Alphaproteobacteria bacterium]|nr:hypothetical protein [Alphaproteobacteria bacterium]
MKVFERSQQLGGETSELFEIGRKGISSHECSPPKGEEKTPEQRAKTPSEKSKDENPDTKKKCDDPNIHKEGYVSVGGEGFRPAVQAGVNYSNEKPDGSSVSTGASATAALGNGVSGSAYLKYDSGSGDEIRYRAGIAAEYNKGSGVTASAGIRVDHQAGKYNPYASVIAKSDGSTTIEAGACTKLDFMKNSYDICAGAQHTAGPENKTTFVIGMGRSF